MNRIIDNAFQRARAQIVGGVYARARTALATATWAMAQHTVAPALHSQYVPAGWVASSRTA